MAFSVFTARAFASVIRAGDAQRFGLDIKTYRDAIIDGAIAEAHKGPTLNPFVLTDVRGKPCVSYQQYSDHLILRLVARDLLHRSRIRLPSRDVIVRGVIETLMDATPMYVLRRDITSFYENVPLAPLKDRLLYDTATSERVRYVLRRYFEQHCSGTSGIPRGVGLSAVMAEMAMQEFDRRVREIPTIHKYYRFSDDIILFCFANPADTATAVSNLLPPGMGFNNNKGIDLALDKVTGAALRQFEYLGYRFEITDGIGSKEARAVEVTISERKIARMKTRVMLALKAFQRHGDFSLLHDRIRFVASNYRVRRHGLSHIGAATHVRSGIFYNYRFCGTYIGTNKGRQIIAPRCAELCALDGYFHSLRKGAGSRFAAKISALPSFQKETLARISFLKGYVGRITVRFSPDRVSQIQRIWRNV